MIPDKYIEYALDRIRTAAKERKENKRKTYNGYKDKPEWNCFYRKTPGAERHEVFFGHGWKDISIKYGFQVDLCSELHRQIHDETDWGTRETLLWRQAYQIVYMDCLEADGLTRDEALIVWMNLINCNYLEDVMPR